MERSAPVTLVALLSTVIFTTQVRALDVGATLGVGELRETGQPGRLYAAQSGTVSVDFTDALDLNVDASATHYLPTPESSGFVAYRLGSGLSWDANDHLTFDLYGTWAPKTGYSFDSGNYRSTSLAASLDASYAFAPGDERVNPELLLGVAAARYHSTDSYEHVSNTASVLQTRFTLGGALEVFADTRLELDAAYYVYNIAAARATDLLAASSGSGMPLEPLRFSLRADLTRKLGALRLGAYVQGGNYIEHSGEGLLAGARLGWVLSTSARVAVSASLQRMLYSGSEAFTNVAISPSLYFLF